MTRRTTTREPECSCAARPALQRPRAARSRAATLRGVRSVRVQGEKGVQDAKRTQCAPHPPPGGKVMMLVGCILASASQSSRALGLPRAVCDALALREQ